VGQKGNRRKAFGKRRIRAPNSMQFSSGALIRMIAVVA
jgi:hypothetical protein